MATTTRFTLDDLKQILIASAGADEEVDLEGDILDSTFADLGYESLALLETGGRIEREWGVSLGDSALIDTTTPRVLIDVVNAQVLTG